jgi:hypothetical protein
MIHIHTLHALDDLSLVYSRLEGKCFGVCGGSAREIDRQDGGKAFCFCFYLFLVAGNL